VYCFLTNRALNQIYGFKIFAVANFRVNWTIKNRLLKVIDWICNSKVAVISISLFWCKKTLNLRCNLQFKFFNLLHFFFIDNESIKNKVWISLFVSIFDKSLFFFMMFFDFSSFKLCLWQTWRVFFHFAGSFSVWGCFGLFDRRGGLKSWMELFSVMNNIRSHLEFVFPFSFFVKFI